MAVDKNVVTFQVNGSDDDLLRAETLPGADDAVRQAWRLAQEGREIQPSDITRVHSTWQPSRMDRVFLAGMFPHAEHTHQFTRPEGTARDEAFDSARDALQRSADTAVEAEQDGEWLPILHTYDGPLKLYASLPLVSGRLYLGFAKTTVGAGGRVGMSHLLRARFEQMSEDELLELVGEACDNLKRGLAFKVHPDEKKGNLVALERGDGNLCAGSAIMLDDFYENTVARVGSEKLIVGLISPDHIYVAGADSGWVGEIEDWVRTSPDTSGDLVPTVLLIEGPQSMKILAERPTGRAPHH